jgi:hypothetical protein
MVYTQSDSTVLKNTNSDYHLILKKSDKNVQLRWAPSTPGLWLNSLAGFIQVERISFDSFKAYQSNKTDILAERLTPWTKEQFELEIKKHPGNSYLPIAQQLMYGDWETLKTKKELDIGTILASREELIHKYSAAMFISDMDPLAAEALGLYFKDTDAPQGKYLIYRIIAVAPNKPPHTAQVLYNPNFDIEAIPNIGSADTEDGYIRITWDRTDHEKHFTAYYIERSEEGVNFKRLNDLPYINATDQKESFGIPPITYIAQAENGKGYYYRIIGIDAFGELSKPSKALKIAAKDKTPPPSPVRVKAGIADGTYMEIFWSQDSVSSDFKGFYILKSNSLEGSYTPVSNLLPASVTMYKDENPDFVNNSYYKVCAVDHSGNQSCSSPVYGFFNDKTPPPIPLGLKGKIDTSGIVHLSWPIASTPDLSGYNVYVANGPDEVFIRKNSNILRDSIWKDTIAINTLTEEIYYKIAAVDVRSNVSDFSDEIKLKKPDKIAPAAPVFKDFKVDSSYIQLFWINSNSKDVVTHILRRRTNGQPWTDVAKITDFDTKFNDKNVEPKTQYEYKIVAIDDDGNESVSATSLKASTLPSKENLSPLKITMDDKNKLTLSLEATIAKEDVSQIVIYKSISKGDFQRWKTVSPATTMQSTDSIINTYKSLAYKYRIFYKDGHKSDYSPVLLVENR